MHKGKLGDSPRPGTATSAALVLILVLIVLFACVGGYLLLQSYRDTYARVEARAQGAAQVVAVNAQWTFETARQALVRIDDALGAVLSVNPTVTGNIHDAVGGLPGNVMTYVVDAEGNTRFTDSADIKPMDIADRDYFTSLANGDEWHVSPLLISRIDGGQIFVISKRIEREGRFVGAAMVAMSTQVMAEIWANLELGPNSTVSLVLESGDLVARFPSPEGPMNISTSPLFTTYLKQADFGSYSAVSVADGVERVVGYRRVPGTDVVAIASIAVAPAFADFWRNLRATLLFAVPALVALVVATFWIGYLLRRDAGRQVELSDALERNQTLMREIHHRVKNNFQAVGALVALQSVPEDVRKDMQRRIAAMAAVHEHIYRTDQYSDVMADEYLPAIVGNVLDGYGDSVAVDYAIAPIRIDRENAMSLALLVNEVVSNALKYAFIDRPAPRISISLQAKGEHRAALTISDNGRGFDIETQSKGMGTRLIGGLSKQVGGTYGYRRDNGTVFELEFETGEVD